MLALPKQEYSREIPRCVETRSAATSSLKVGLCWGRFDLCYHLLKQ